jgi:ribosomal protein S27AE
MGDDMEKYGVDETIDQEKLEKSASEGCPKCGGKVTRHGAILICKNCGTEPFEQGNGS